MATKQYCRLCGNQTKTIFNIQLNAVPVCECCANAIFLQQAIWYTKQKIKTK